MQQSERGAASDEPFGRILFLSHDPVLGVDLNEALGAVGLPRATRLSNLDPTNLMQAYYRAAILDFDQLDPKWVDLVRSHLPEGTPVLAISDTYDVARDLDVPEDSWFVRPLQTDLLAQRVSERLMDVARDDQTGTSSRGADPFSHKSMAAR